MKICRFLIIFCLIEFFHFSVSFGEEDAQKVDSIKFPSSFEEFQQNHLKPSWNNGFDSKGVWLYSAGILATLLSFSYDDKVRSEYRDHKRHDQKFTRVGSVWASGSVGAGIAGLQLWLDRPNGMAHMEAQLFTAANHISIVAVSQRRRPSRKEYTSMPSGHSANAFAIATSLTYSYGWWAAVPAYGMAAVTVLSRLSDDVHYFSDVVAGAFLGIFWGRATHFHHSSGEVKIEPVVSNEKLGLGVSWSW